MFSTKDDAFNLFTTATIKSSNPARLPWLSNAGTQINILKLNQIILDHLIILDGIKLFSNFDHQIFFCIIHD